MRTDFLLYRHPDDFMIAVQGTVFTFILIIFSALSIHFSQIIMPLGWLSLTGIFLWPRWSHTYLTPILIAVLGLVADLLLGRFLGLSSFIFLVFFWLVKPTQREESLNLFRSWLEFSFASVIILFVSLFIIGRVVDLSVGWLDLSWQILAVIGVFPVVYAVRAIFRRWLINPNNVNYQ